MKRASLQASKPDMEEVWDELLTDLNEQMPQKRKKRPFIYMMPVLLCMTAIGSLVFLKPTPALTSSLPAKQAEKPTQAGKGHASLPAAGAPSQTTQTPATVTAHNQNTVQAHLQGSVSNTYGSPHSVASGRNPRVSRQAQNAGNTKPDPLHEDAFFFADADSYDWLAPGYGRSAAHIFPLSLKTEAIEYIPSPEDMDKLVIRETDSVKEEKKDDKSIPPVRSRRNFSIGGSLSYNFNNFTSGENRSSSKIFNGAYQVYKQTGINVYCRIPLTHAWQVQPELGLEPQSTRIQINYRTEGLNVFQRYQINRLLYTHFGFSGYYELQKNVYLIGGAYYACALPHYGARMEQVNQEPGKDPTVLSSVYEHRDYRKDVFGLNRSDYGVLGGIEWHRGKLSTAIRAYRGLTDVTPETPTNYHNFNISLRFGYHLEFSK